MTWKKGCFCSVGRCFFAEIFDKFTVDMQFWKLSHINLIAIFWRLQSKREAIRVEDLYQVCIWVHRKPPSLSKRHACGPVVLQIGGVSWHEFFRGSECYWIWETVEERYFGTLVLAEWLSRAISGRFPSAYLEALQQPLPSVTRDLFALVSRHGGHDDFLSLKVLGQRTPKGKQQEGHDSETDWEVWTSAQVECPEVQQPQLIFCGDPSWWNVVSFLGRFFKWRFCSPVWLDATPHFGMAAT